MSGLNMVLAKHPKQRDSLIPLLQAVQDATGYLSEEAIDVIAEHLDVSTTDVYATATFYTQFRFRAPGRHMIKVCEGTACHVRNGRRVLEEVTRRLNIAPGQTTEDGRFSLETVACFGSCALSPVMVVNNTVHGRVTPDDVAEILEACR